METDLLQVAWDFAEGGAGVDVVEAEDAVFADEVGVIIVDDQVKGGLLALLADLGYADRAGGRVQRHASLQFSGHDPAFT